MIVRWAPMSEARFVTNRALWLWIALQCLSSCGTTLVVTSLPLTIGPNWTEIKLDSPLRPTYGTQGILLQLDEPSARAEFAPPGALKRPILLIFPDSQSIEVFAQVVMTNGTVRSLKGHRHTCPGPGYDVVCKMEFGDDLPHAQTVSVVRLRASAPLKIVQVSWIDANSK